MLWLKQQGTITVEMQLTCCETKIDKQKPVVAQVDRWDKHSTCTSNIDAAFECSQQKTINPWINCHSDLQWHSTPKTTGGQCPGHKDC